MSESPAPTAIRGLNHGAVVIKAWAPWCGSCRNLSPIVDRVAADAPSVAVVDVNVGLQPDLVERFEIRAVPTLVALHEGIEVGRLSGLQSAISVRSLFDAAAGAAIDVRPSSPVGLIGARGAAGVVLLGSGVALGSLVLVVIGTMLIAWAGTGLVARSMGP